MVSGSYEAGDVPRSLFLSCLVSTSRTTSLICLLYSSRRFVTSFILSLYPSIRRIISSMEFRVSFVSGKRQVMRLLLFLG